MESSEIDVWYDEESGSFAFSFTVSNGKETYDHPTSTGFSTEDSAREAAFNLIDAWFDSRYIKSASIKWGMPAAHSFISILPKDRPPSAVNADLPASDSFLCNVLFLTCLTCSRSNRLMSKSNTL
mgnify:CR=1 FL=1